MDRKDLAGFIIVGVMVSFSILLSNNFLDVSILDSSQLENITLKVDITNYTVSNSSLNNNSYINQSYLDSWLGNLSFQVSTAPLDSPSWVDNLNASNFSVSGSSTPVSWGVNSDSPKGVQSLNLVASTNRSEIYKTFSSPQDLSNKIFTIWIKVQNWSNINVGNDFSIGFRETGGNLEYFPFNKLSGYEEQDNEWIQITFGESDFGGSINLSDINRIYFRGQAISGTQNMSIAYLEARDIVEGEGLISIMFDDGRSSTLDGANIMAKYGFSGSNGVARGSVDEIGYLSLSEMRLLETNYGWEHLTHGSAIYDMTDSEREIELKNAKQWMISNGFGKSSEHYVYPNGYIDENMKNVLQDYYTSGRTVTRTSHGKNSFAKYNIGGISVQTSESPSTINGYIDDGISKNEWVIVSFHRIGSGVDDYDKSDFEEIIRHIFDSGYDVRLYSDVVNNR